MLSFRIPVAIIAVLMSSLPVTAQTPGPEQEVRQVIEQYNAFNAVKDVNGLMSLYHDQMDFPPLDRKTMRKGVETGLESQKTPSRLELLEVRPHGEAVCARIRFVESTGEASKDTALYILRPQDGRLRISGICKEADPNAFDPKTRIYTSRKGRLSIRLPEGWTALSASEFMGGIVPDSVYVLAPDLRSSVTLGFVQLPMKLGPDDLATAQKGLEADSALERRFTVDYKVVEQGPIQVAGRQGYRMVTEFKIPMNEGAGRKRMRVYLSEHPMLYFFICDAMPPEGFQALAPQFESIVSSLDLTPAQGDLTRQEVMAAEQAKGHL